MKELDFTITDSVVEIKNSYLIPRSEILPIIRSLKSIKPDNPVLQNRSAWHIAMELAVHDFLYMIGYETDRTKDIDWDYPQPLMYKIGYAVFGPLVWFIIPNKTQG